MPLTNHKTTS